MRKRLASPKGAGRKRALPLKKPTPLLSRKFEDALVFATRLHAGQSRKGRDVPYVTHLLSVAALVLEDGGSEDEAIAALLHDAVEDQGGLPTLKAIERRFGKKVAAIVEGCTDAYTIPKPPWGERKEQFIAHVEKASPEVRRVSLADKVHNARTVLADYRVLGESLWSRFKGGKQGTIWYYRTLEGCFRRAQSGPLVDELDRVVRDLEALVACSGP